MALPFPLLHHADPCWLSLSASRSKKSGFSPNPKTKSKMQRWPRLASCYNSAILITESCLDETLQMNKTRFSTNCARKDRQSFLPCERSGKYPNLRQNMQAPEPLWIPDEPEYRMKGIYSQEDCQLHIRSRLPWISLTRSPYAFACNHRNVPEYWIWLKQSAFDTSTACLNSSPIQHVYATFDGAARSYAPASQYASARTDAKDHSSYWKAFNFWDYADTYAPCHLLSFERCTRGNAELPGIPQYPTFSLLPTRSPGSCIIWFCLGLHADSKESGTDESTNEKETGEYAKATRTECLVTWKMYHKRTMDIKKEQSPPISTVPLKELTISRTAMDKNVIKYVMLTRYPSLRLI